VARAALAVPFVVPVLPVQRFIAYQAALGAVPDSSEKKEMGPLPQLYADMFGWDELADAVAVAAATLTPEERAHAGVLSRTGYGDRAPRAGARAPARLPREQQLLRLGPARGGRPGDDPHGRRAIVGRGALPLGHRRHHLRLRPVHAVRAAQDDLRRPRVEAAP